MAKRKRDSKGRFVKSGRSRSRARKGKRKGKGKGGGGGQTLMQRLLWIAAGGAAAAIVASAAAKAAKVGKTQQTREIAKKAPLLMVGGGAALALIPRVPSPLKLIASGIAAVGLGLVIGQRQAAQGQPALTVAQGQAPALPSTATATAQGYTGTWAQRARRHAARRLEGGTAAQRRQAAIMDGAANVASQPRSPGLPAPASRLVSSSEPVVSPAVYSDTMRVLRGRRGGSLVYADPYHPGQAGYRRR